jgi:hypothetical protein
MGTKVTEIGVALVAPGLARGSMALECAAIFLIATQAALTVTAARTPTLQRGDAYDR